MTGLRPMVGPDGVLHFAGDGSHAALCGIDVNGFRWVAVPSNGMCSACFWRTEPECPRCNEKQTEGVPCECCS